MPPIPLIAVVDDDIAVRDAVVDLLEVIRLDAHAFADAESFLATYRPGQYGCVLTDMRMGGLSGVDLASRLATLEPDLPVILLTAEPAAAMKFAGTESARAVLAKPVDASDLISQVLKALGQDG